MVMTITYAIGVLFGSMAVVLAFFNVTAWAWVCWIAAVLTYLIGDRINMIT